MLPLMETIDNLDKKVKWKFEWFGSDIYVWQIFDWFNLNFSLVDEYASYSETFKYYQVWILGC